ncbi:hypothetical protein L9F63_013728, partial [Diploptera punctata]
LGYKFTTESTTSVVGFSSLDVNRVSRVYDKLAESTTRLGVSRVFDKMPSAVSRVYDKPSLRQ